MLQVYTRKNYLDKEKGNYVFHSRTSQTVGYEGLIKRMLQYNSTITDSDIRSVMSVFFTILLRCTAQGDYVQTPIGSFWACAAGTTEDIEAAFEPRNAKTNHAVDLKFRLIQAARGILLGELEVERVSSAFVTRPDIADVLLVNDGGKAEKSPVFAPGSTMRLRGSGLMLDAADARQGVEFHGEGGSAKVAKYHRNTSRTLDVEVPPELPAGKYKVSVTTKPGRERYATATAEQEVSLVM